MDIMEVTKTISSELEAACWAVGDKLIKDSGDMPTLEKLYEAAKTGEADPDELIQKAAVTPYWGPRRALMIAADLIRDRKQMIGIHIHQASAILQRDGRRKEKWVGLVKEYPILTEWLG